MSTTPRIGLPFDKNKQAGAVDCSVVTSARKYSASLNDPIQPIQYGMFFDVTKLLLNKKSTTTPNFNITSFSVTNEQLIVNVNGLLVDSVDILFYTSVNVDLTNSTLLSRKLNISLGSTVLANTPIIGNYYYATVSGGGINRTTPVLQYSGIPIESSPPDVAGYDIILITGQSNGQGYGAQTIASETNSFIYGFNALNNGVALITNTVPQSNTILYQENGTAVDLSANLISTGGFLSKTTGKCPAVNFANEYVTRGYLNPNRRVLLVQTSIGAVSFSPYSSPGTDPNGKGWWAWPSTPGDLSTSGLGFRNLMYRAAAAMNQTYSGSLKQNNRIVGLIWQDGESEGSNGTPSVQAAAYSANLSTFVTSVRSGLLAQLTNASLTNLTAAQASLSVESMTILIGAMTPPACVGTDVSPGSVVSRGAVITTQAISAASSIPRAVYVPNTGTNPTSDVIHYNTTDTDFLSFNFADSYKTRVVTEVQLSITPTSYVVRWTLPTTSAVDLQLWSNGTTNSTTGGTQDGSDVLVSAGVTTYSVTQTTLLPNVFYYVRILPKVSGCPIGISQPSILPVLRAEYDEATQRIQDKSGAGRTITYFNSGAAASSYHQIDGRTSLLGNVRTTMRLEKTTLNFFTANGNFNAGPYTKTGWIFFPDILPTSSTGVNLISCSTSSTGPYSLFWINASAAPKTWSQSGQVALNGDVVASPGQAVNNVSLSLNKWYFAAAVFNEPSAGSYVQTTYVYDVRTQVGTTIRVPTLVTSTTSTPSANNTGMTRTTQDVIFIGNYIRTATIGERYYLDDIRLYDKALTPAQIYSIAVST